MADVDPGDSEVEIFGFHFLKFAWFTNLFITYNKVFFIANHNKFNLRYTFAIIDLYNNYLSSIDVNVLIKRNKLILNAYVDFLSNFV